ncbi:MAG: DUF2066 domain-containing protein [Pseudomonadota bacterium]
MPFRFILAVLAVLGSFFSIAAAQSANRQVFIVPEVPVFAEADTAAAAQRIAQDKGRRIAMDILLRRLTAEEDWIYLPNLAANQAPSAGGAEPTPIDVEFGQEFDLDTKSAVDVTSESLATYEEGFSIFDEKTSARTYRARITYRFKPNAVRSMLERAGLPYSEAQARRALILPVLETEGGTYLWETRNPWARAWLARPLINALTPLELPNGDRQDINLASVGEVTSLDQSTLRELSNRYQTPQIILARGRLRQTEGEYLLSVQLIDAYLDGRGGNRQRIEETSRQDEAARLYDSDDGFGSDGVRGGTGAQTTGRILAEAFFRGPDSDFPALAQRAVETTVSRYAQGWKQQTLVDHSEIRPLMLTAWFGSLDEWADIRNALEDTPLVRKMDVGVFTNQSAVIELLVIGKQEQFSLALQQENLSVWQSPDGRWNVASFERAQELQMQMEDASFQQPEIPSGMIEQQGLPVNEATGLRDGPINARAAPGTRDSAIQDGSPTSLELPDELFGPEEEPLGPPPGTPVSLEEVEPEAGTDGDER